MTLPPYQHTPNVSIAGVSKYLEALSASNAALSVDSTDAVATDALTFDSSSLTFKRLPRDWITTEETRFSGTPEQKIHAAALEAAQTGKILRLKRNATYDTTTMIDFSTALAAGDLTIQAEGANINFGGAYAYRMQAFGTESAKRDLTANAPANSFTVALPTGRGALDGWAVGDIFAVESTLDVYGPDVGATVKYIRARELHEVYSVSGDTLTLDGPLLFAYTTAAGARYSRIVTGGRLRILGGLGFRQSVVVDGYTFVGKWLKDLEFEGYHAEDHYGGLQLRECVNARIVSPTSKRNPSSSNPWYYLLSLVGSCMGTRIHGYTARGGASESSFTTLSDERAIGTGIEASDPDSPNNNTYWGGPINTTLTAPDVVMGALGAGIGSHSAGYGLTIESGNVIGGLTNYTLRCRSMKLIGCSGLASAGRSIYSPTSADDLQILGGEFGQCQTEGMALAADRSRVVGAYVHDTGLSGTGVGIAPSGADSEVIGTTVREGKGFGLQCSGTTRLRVIECNMPKGTNQTLAINSLGATDVVKGGIYTGYGAAVNPFANVNAAARLTGMLTDSLGGPTPPKYTVGRYVGAPGSAAATAPANQELGAYPIWIPTFQVFDEIGINVTVAGEAGSLIRLGIYADNGSSYPGARILDAGTVVGDGATGYKSISISQLLPPGQVWLSAVVYNAVTTRPTIRRVTSGQLGATATTGANAGAAVQAGIAPGAQTTLPDPFPSAQGSSGFIPHVVLRAA